jgi:predicted nucleic acid-binding protein
MQPATQSRTFEVKYREKGMVAIRKLRLYLETTVFNYYFDTDRDGHEDTVRLFEAIGRGKFEGYASEYVTEELERTQEPKRSEMLTLVEKYGIKILDYVEQIKQLTVLYIENRIIPEKYRIDSAHIAMASIYNLDCIVSYNFKHINRSKTKILTAHINREAGYSGVVICTSKEVLDDEI